MIYDQANYQAIKILEDLGIEAPTQEQIDVIEHLVELAGIDAANCDRPRV